MVEHIVGLVGGLGIHAFIGQNLLVRLDASLGTTLL